MSETVLITGGEGGIARVLKKRLERDGYHVVALGKDVYDVTFERNSQYYMKKHQPDILVNNAGVFYPGSIKDGSVREWMETLYVNIMGSYYATRYALAFGCRKFIHIGASSSLDARYPGFSAYNVSKAGLVALSNSLSVEGYCSVCVSPGRTDTRLRDRMAPGEDKKIRLSPVDLAGEIVWILDNIEGFSGCEIVVKKASSGSIYVYRRKCGLDYGGERWIH